MKTNLQKGFTLIELMIVVAIVGILAAVVYPSYQDSIIKTKRAEGRAVLMEIMQQQERYYTQNNTYIASDDAAYNFKTHSGESATGSSYEIEAEACTDDIGSCVMLTAIPNNAFEDVKCGDLTLESTGNKTVTGTPASGQTALELAMKCWK